MITKFLAKRLSRLLFIYYIFNDLIDGNLDLIMEQDILKDLEIQDYNKDYFKLLVENYNLEDLVKQTNNWKERIEPLMYASLYAALTDLKVNFLKPNEVNEENSISKKTDDYKLIISEYLILVDGLMLHTAFFNAILQKAINQIYHINQL